jgi:1-acyl-sn-glycerol-3-phosphate acyltransferase
MVDVDLDVFAARPTDGGDMRDLGLRWAESARGARRACGLVATTVRLVVQARREASPSARGYAERAQRTARALLAQHGVEVRTSGSPPGSAAVLVANHLSYLDPLVVAAVTPCIAIAKGETDRWPLIGPGLRALGVLFLRRGDAYSGAVTLRRASRLLAAGASLLNFPEGTTSDGRLLGPFRRGVFGLGRIAGVPIVPTLIAYDDPRVPWFGSRAFLPHYWGLARRVVRVGVRVQFGQAIGPDVGDDPAAIAAVARAAVDAMRRGGASRVT